jgi:hypothetical protein
VDGSLARSNAVSDWSSLVTGPCVVQMTADAARARSSCRPRQRCPPPVAASTSDVPATRATGSRPRSTAAGLMAGVSVGVMIFSLGANLPVRGQAAVRQGDRASPGWRDWAPPGPGGRFAQRESPRGRSEKSKRLSERSRGDSAPSATRRGGGRDPGRRDSPACRITRTRRLPDPPSGLGSPGCVLPRSGRARCRAPSGSQRERETLALDQVTGGGTFGRRFIQGPRRRAALIDGFGAQRNCARPGGTRITRAA